MITAQTGTDLKLLKIKENRHRRQEQRRKLKSSIESGNPALLRNVKTALNRFIFLETAFNKRHFKTIIQETADPRPTRDPFILYMRDRIYNFMYYQLEIKDFNLINKVLDDLIKTETERDRAREQRAREREQALLLIE